MGILLRAYIYARLLGAEGMRRVSEFATLNANYLQARCAMPASSSPTRSGAPAMSSSSP